MTLAQVGFTPIALAQLDQMVDAYELPASTRKRVALSVAHLAEFPDSGSPLEGRHEDLRFVLGPWTWMLIIYAHLDDLVAITTIEDSRTANAATAGR